jgi:hypothetical protein
MKIIKVRENAMSSTYDERLQMLNLHVIWDETIDLFKVFRNNIEGHHGQIGAGYLFDKASDFIL